MVILSIGFSIFRVFRGIFQGLGYPTIVAIVIFISQDIIGLALILILLFAVGFRDDTDYGLYSIWSGTTLGYFLAAIMVVIILCVKNKSIWIDATNDSKSRINKSLIDTNKQNQENSYGSIN